MAHVNCVIQVQSFHPFRQVVGISIEIIAFPGLAGTAVATAIMRDAAITARREKEHLVFESIGTQRPSVAEYDGLAFAPVFVKDVCPVLCFYHAHITPLFIWFI